MNEIMQKYSFRQASAADLSKLDEIRQEKLHKLHLGRLEEQKKGQSEYIIAFVNENPVGHIFILYGRDDRHPFYPQFQDLFVKESMRGQGIAIKMLLDAEKRVRNRDFHEVYLEYEITKPQLKKFYENRGYLLLGGPYDETWGNFKRKGRSERATVYRMSKKL